MTEKRYKMFDLGSPYLTFCGIKTDDDYFENMTECCDELNRLSEKNEQLKQQNTYLKDEVFKLVNTISKFPKQLEDNRKEYQDIEMKLNTLKKWYVHRGNVAFNEREFKYLNSLRGDFE